MIKKVPMNDPIPICDLVSGVCVGGDDCLWAIDWDDDGSWYVEIFPDGIAYTYYVEDRS